MSGSQEGKLRPPQSASGHSKDLEALSHLCLFGQRRAGDTACHGDLSPISASSADCPSALSSSGISSPDGDRCWRTVALVTCPEAFAQHSVSRASCLCFIHTLKQFGI